MTFFLKSPDEVNEIQPVGPDVAPSGFMSGLGAATDKMWLETDAFFRHDNDTKTERLFTAEPAARRVGIDALNKRYQDAGAGYDHLRPAPTTVDDFLAMHGDEGTQIALDLAREAAEADPGQWADLDLTDEGIEKRTTEARRREHEDLTETLDMMPAWRGTAEFVGGMLGATVDPRNVPFLIAGGGGGSIMRIMGREAMLNGAAEAVTLPSQYRVAEELGNPDPNAVQQIGLGAAAGAILGGATAAIGRAIHYFNGRSQSKAPDPYRAAAEDAAEDAIVKGQDPFKAAQQVLDTAPPLPRKREPLILMPADRIPESVTARTPEPTALAPDPITSEVLPPPEGIRPETPDEIAAIAERGIDDADATVRGLEAEIAKAKAEDDKALRPLIQMMRRKSKGGGTFQVHPDGAFGLELKSRGINARSYPGMFSKNGRMDFDNLVADEMEQALPGIKEAAGVADDGMYLNRDGLLALIEREAAGDSSWLTTRQIAKKAEAELDAHLEWVERGSPADDYLSRRAGNDGYVVQSPGNVAGFDPNFDQAEWTASVERGFNDFITRRGYRLLDEERAEILAELQQRGGDAEYLVERAFERERDEILDLAKGNKESADDDFLPFGDEDTFDGSRGDRIPDETPGEDAGRRGERAGDAEPGPGADGAGREAGVEPARVERTEAGDQLVIPGAEQRAAPTGMTSRQRAEVQARAQQSKIGRLDQQRVEDDAGGLFSSQQRDMFDDPSSPQARPMQDQITADIRDQIEAEGDFMVDLGDGRGARSASSLLDELDADDEFSAMLDLCGKPRGNA